MKKVKRERQQLVKCQKKPKKMDVNIWAAAYLIQLESIVACASFKCCEIAFIPILSCSNKA